MGNDLTKNMGINEGNKKVRKTLSLILQIFDNIDNSFKKIKRKKDCEVCSKKVYWLYPQ
ncbi:hypothetical protein BACAU_2815 [Bacillus velezensis CAU B946]|nr:hypothetical protein BACAU_2815 [Bacillus velezensis CAU B946]